MDQEVIRQTTKEPGNSWVIREKNVILVERSKAGQLEDIHTFI